MPQTKPGTAGSSLTRLHPAKPLDFYVDALESKYAHSFKHSTAEVDQPYSQKPSRLTQAEKRVLKKIDKCHARSEQCIREVKFMNGRQDNIILNALQFINDVVEQPENL